MEIQAINLRYVRSLLTLSLFCFACNEDGASTEKTTNEDVTVFGGENMDRAVDLVGGNSGETGSECFGDEQCPEGLYCFIESGLKGTCEDGCQEDGLGCEPGQLCDLDTRECVYPPCDNDSGCPTGTYCNANGLCETGCRADERCLEEEDEMGRPLRCDIETRQCIPHAPCCLDAEAECRLSTEATCMAAGGQLLTNSLSCTPSPCGPSCELDIDCIGLDSPTSSYYCDSIDLRCRSGCRTGGCEGDLVCDLTRRVCQDQRCTRSDECADHQYCDPINLVCRTGCDQDSDCDAGFSCVNNACIERCDPDNDRSCEDGYYCDEVTLACRIRCQEHADCNEQEACDHNSGTCLRGVCRDDESLGDLLGEPNDTPEQAIELPLTPLTQGGAIGLASERVSCGPNKDLYQITLGQGERLRLTLSHGVEGNLNTRLYSIDDANTPLITGISPVSPEQVEYPPLGQTLPTQDLLVEVIGQTLVDERVPYTLTVQIAPPGNACFADSRELDEGDNRFETATDLVVNGRSRYDDGSLCVEDIDWFQLPLSTNDGLSIQLITLASAPLIRGEIYSGGPLQNGLGSATPRFTLTDVESTLNEEETLRVYSLNIESDMGIFTDEIWYLKVNAVDPELVVDYQLEVEHRSSGLSCIADAQEPNNGRGSGTSLEMDFDFIIDNAGQLALGRDNRIRDMTLCSGDTDYYCLNINDGDLIEAWAIGDEVIGTLAVRVVDDEGGRVGSEGVHTERGQNPSIASLVGGQAGRYCIVVDGLNNAQGSYELTVRRSAPNGGGCEQDEEMNRNDTADTASSLGELSEGNNLRFEKRNGLLCDPNQDPVDWYQFNVAYPKARICATLEGFNHDRADLDLELFEPPIPDTLTCDNDRTCESIDGSACIEGSCQVSAVTSAFSYDFESVIQSKNLSEEGLYRLRVSRGAVGEVTPYDLRVTVTPEREICRDDWQEDGDPNDLGGYNSSGQSRSTILGSGHVGFCDAWICQYPDGSKDDDWYQITVPANEDRSVLISFDRQSDGQLELFYFGSILGSIMGPEPELLIVSSLYDFQCFNIRGGSTTQDIELAVHASSILNDGDQRVDYSLRVIPTDLDVTPNGACSLLGAGQLPTCTNGDLRFVDNCWPEVPLP